MMGASKCRILEWDSDFFGHRIARVESMKMDASTLAEVRAFGRAESIDCFYYLADAADEASIREAESGGFRCVDVRVTRERALTGVGTDCPREVVAYRDEDLPDLRAIARSSHTASRFYHDPHFARERCDALYDAWISKACTETPDHVLVVRREDRAVGYLACELDSASMGTIGLVAVAESARGRHLGSRLVEGALAWFARRGRERVRVVSQGRNLASARLYESLGFRTSSIEHWYHLWLRPEDRP